MAAQRKSASATQLIQRLEKPNAPHQEASIAAIGDAEGAAPVTSPARDLQKRLRGHFNPMVREFSARFVTLAVALTCLGTWVAGFGLHSTL